MANLSMDEANRRDYAAKGKFDAAIQALRDVLSDESCASKIGAETRGVLAAAEHRLQERSDHIVAVWD